MEFLITKMYGLRKQHQECLSTVENIHNDLTHPDSKHTTLVDAIRTLPKGKERDKLKEQLPVVCYNSIFNKSTDVDNIRLTGYFFIDIDSFGDLNREEVFDLLCSLDYVNLVYRSASTGVHAIAKYELAFSCNDYTKEQIKKEFKAVFSFFKNKLFTDVNLELDIHTSNYNRPTFIPYDRGAYLNKQCTPITIDNATLPVFETIDNRPVARIKKTDAEIDQQLVCGMFKIIGSVETVKKRLSGAGIRMDNVVFGDKTVAYTKDYKSLTSCRKNKRNGVLHGKRNKTMLDIANEVLSVRQYENMADFHMEVEYWNQTYCNPPLEKCEVASIVKSVFHRGVEPKKGRPKFTAKYDCFETASERKTAACQARKLHKNSELFPYLDASKTIEENFELVSKIESNDPVIVSLLKKLNTPAKLRAYLVRNGVEIKGSKVCDFVKANYDDKISIRKNAEKMGIDKSIIRKHLKTINSGKYEPYQIVLPACIKNNLRASDTGKKSFRIAI